MEGAGRAQLHWLARSPHVPSTVWLTLACPLQDKQSDPQAFDSMGIMRSYVRRAILSRVPQDAVHYGKVCVAAQPARKPGDPVRMEFSDGSTEECDLLVVADGANSKVRTALLPQEVNRYAGVCMLMVRSSPLRSHAHQCMSSPHLNLNKRILP